MCRSLDSSPSRAGLINDWMTPLVKCGFNSCRALNLLNKSFFVPVVQR